VLVFHGRWRKSLTIYDRHGSEIGVAARGRDRYSEVGYRYHYDLQDSELRCVLRDITKRRIGLESRSYAFAVHAPDGAEIGEIRRAGGVNDYTISSDGVAMASVRHVPWRRAARDHATDLPVELGRRERLIDRFGSRVWYVSDEWQQTIGRVTHLMAVGERVSYVLALEDKLAEPLRTILLTICMVVDNRITDNSPG
jgi:hypothetical protein